jgi:hypothetical protein
MQSLSLDAMNLSPAVRPLGGFWIFPARTAGNSEGTAEAAAVLVLAKPSTAQDFRGERDVDG